MTLSDHAARENALLDFQHNLVVTAGAGTGKTSLLVGRLASALIRLHLEPNQVLALTFTENAAAEMRERLVRLLRAVEPWLAGESIEASDAHVLEALQLGAENLSRVRAILEVADDLPISTFHAFCGSLLRRFARRLDLPPELRADAPEARAPAFAEAFLDYLRQQEEPHPALERFDPKELRELARELLALPGEAIEAHRRPPPPPDLAALGRELEAIAAAWPKALAKFRDCVSQLIDAAARLARGEHPDPQEFPTKRYSPGQSVPANQRTGVADRVAEIRGELKPHVLADEASVSIALDFLAPFVAHYRRDVLTRGELTFDDVIFEARRCLMDDSQVREDAGGGLRAILVDEFQDTDPLQYDIVFLLAAAQHAGPIERPLDAPLRPGTLFLVGDPKQSIYRFRGADLAAFDVAQRRVREQGGLELVLSSNFRSAPEILAFVNHAGPRLLEDAPPYQLGYQPVEAALTRTNARVELVTPADDQKRNASGRRDLEGRVVVELLRERHEQGVRWSDMAVLLRAATDTSWLLRPLREADVPYVLEGSRRFYQRQEIVVASALLGALARPHDPVPVLGVLRSALSAATDLEVLGYVREHGRFALDYRGTPPRGDCRVAATLTWLTELHATLQLMPTDAALEVALGLDDWFIAEGSGYEGAQRLANLERLLHTLRRARPLDLAAAAEFVETRTNQETEDEESPLFDQGLDAVRVMTVHASKGLEFEVVVVPDLVRKSSPNERRSDARVERAFDAHGKSLVGIRVGSVRNAASLLLEKEQKQHRGAEDLRLLYVAATRAERELVLVGSHDVPNSSWQGALEACQLDGLIERRSVDPNRLRRPDRRPRDVEPTLESWRAHERIAARLAPDAAVAELRPTKVARVSEFAAAPSGAAATELGTALHRYLALVDPESHGVDSDLRAALDRAEFESQLGDMVAAFHGSELESRIAGADRALRELPVSYLGDSGGVQHGVIDLLLEEAGEFTVIDYKTDRVAANRHREAAEVHRVQLARYAEGVARALRLDAPPRQVVWFARDDVSVQLS